MLQYGHVFLVSWGSHYQTCNVSSFCLPGVCSSSPDSFPASLGPHLWYTWKVIFFVLQFLGVHALFSSSVVEL